MGSAAHARASSSPSADCAGLAVKVAVAGASGYTGLELLRIVQRHPQLELAAATSEQRAGQGIGEAFPALRGLFSQAFEPLHPERLAGRAEAAFVCLPHASAAPVVAALRAQGLRVVDLSADFRLRDRALYEEWYGLHKAPELFGQAVYGLPEVYKEELRGAGLIAAAGCYPTGALLPMLPLLRAGAVRPAPIAVDAKSGVSGAGRSLQEGYLFGELDSNLRAYKVAAHRHAPEMEQEARRAAEAGGASGAVSVTFVPQLLPVIRGIATTVFLHCAREFSAAQARELLQAAYADAPFVRVLPEGETPSLSAVRGSNFCDVGVFADERSGLLVCLSALDNLVKGASGQAVQCLNLACGWPETLGLEEAPLTP